jgi:hypothetical protein
MYLGLASINFVHGFPEFQIFSKQKVLILEVNKKQSYYLNEAYSEVCRRQLPVTFIQGQKPKK